MKHVRLFTSTGLAGCLFLVGVGWAHGQREVRDAPVRRTSTVLGARVRLENNVSYGEVKDFVFNDNGCIDYVVIANGDDYVLVPWAVATFDFAQRTVRIDVSRDKIRQLAFARDRWPNLSEAGYTGKLRTVFGDRAERREHRTGQDGDRRNGASTGREPARDNPSRSNRDERPVRERDPQDNRSREQRSGPDRRDAPPAGDRDTPRKSGEQKKPERSDRPKP